MNVPLPRIAALGTATGRFPLGQDAAKAIARSLFHGDGDGDDGDMERLLGAFDHAGVRCRQLCVEPEWFTRPHSFRERNERWRTESLDLACAAAADAIARAAVTADDIGCVVVLASTGIATPSLDVDVIQRLGLPAHGIHHETVFGRGCAGGAVGLARGAQFAASAPGRAALVIAVEVCSLVRDAGDVSPTDLVGAALFSDGAAAAVVTTEADGPAIAGTDHLTLPATHGAMGWDVGDAGLRLVLDRNVPALVRRHAAGSVDAACAAWDMDLADIDHVIAHPGSARVLDALERALDLPAAALDDSRAVLAAHGNMSAPTVWFVLARTWGRIDAGSGTLGLLTAMGPGFSIEHVLLRW